MNPNALDGTPPTARLVGIPRPGWIRRRLSQLGRVRRKGVRLEAARMFEQGLAARQVAAELRVTTKSVYRWRRISVSALAGAAGQTVAQTLRRV